MRKRLEKIIAGFFALFFVCLASPIQAEEPAGSLTVQMETTQQLPGEGIEFSLVQCASRNEKEKWVLDAPYTDSGLDFNDPQTDWSAAARTLEPVVRKQNAVQSAKTDASGRVVFTGLASGMYLLLSDSDQINPSLVAVPGFDAMTGTLMYNVTAEPKYSLYPLLVIHKVDAQTRENILHASFEFTSFSDPECTHPLVHMQGDPKTGTVSFSLAEGTIYIKETKAPSRYRLSDRVLKVERTKEAVRINGKALNNENGVYSIDFENQKSEKPNTGVELNRPWTLFGLSLILGTLAMILLRKETA